METLKKHKEYILLGLILLAAAFLRLYRIADYMTFLGDEGRDVLVVKGILEGNLTLLGPRASAGDFFTGPIYYYMMAPFLWLFHLNPVGPSVMIALLGVSTVYLIYRFGKEFFGTTAALVAATLYTVSPLVIAYSRSSWNPNPMPFFTLLILYLLYRSVISRSLLLFFVVGILYGIAFQLHYIELFVGVVIFFFVWFGNVLEKQIRQWRLVLKECLVLFGGFILGFSPFLLFELRHGFPNIRTIISFIISGSPTATDLTQQSSVQIIFDVFFRLFGRLIWYFPQPEHLSDFSSPVVTVWKIIILISSFLAIFYLFRVKNKLVVLLFSLWLFWGVILFGLYKKPIYDYYFEFMFPLPFFLMGNMIAKLFKTKRYMHSGKILSSIVFIGLVCLNLSGNPFRYEPNRQLNQIKTISEFVLSKTEGKPYNFALLAKGNSDHGYRYFFEAENRKPVMIENLINDPKRASVTKQLLIVCEYTDCEPLGNSLFEVAGFGRAEIAGQWDVSVVRVYRLVPYVENK